MGTFTRVIVIWLHFSYNYYFSMVYKVTCHSTSRYCKALQLKTTINALDLIVFCQKNNIDLWKFFIFCVLKNANINTTIKRKGNKRKRKKEEKKPKNYIHVSRRNKIKQLNGIKYNVNCNYSIIQLLRLTIYTFICTGLHETVAFLLNKNLVVKVSIVKCKFASWRVSWYPFK